MDASDPPDCAEGLGSVQASPPVRPPIANDKSANMLEDKIVHPAKRVWNTDADEVQESSKRARLSESVENRLNDNSSNEIPPQYVNAASSVQNQDKDTNGDGSSEHLPRDASNGALDSSPKVNNSSVDTDSSQKEINPAPSDTSPADSPVPVDTSTSVEQTSAPVKETNAVTSNNEDESMDVESDSVASSAPVTPKPSGLETQRTETTENSKNSLECSAPNSPSGAPTSSGTAAAALQGQTKDSSDLKTDSPADVLKMQDDGRSSPSSPQDEGSKTSRVGEPSADADRLEGKLPRTDSESSAGKTKTSDLENGEEDQQAPTPRPSGSVSNLKDIINERFRDQISKKDSADCKTASGKEDEETTSRANEDSKSQTNKNPSRSPSPEDDVIVLSDDDVDENGAKEDDASSIATGPFSPLPDDNPLSKLSDIELDQRDKAIHDLQEELRTEEGKLLLLKKLRQSQLQPVQVVPKEGVGTGTSTSTSSGTPATTNAGSTLPTQSKVSQAPTVNTSLPQLLRTSQGTKIQLSAHQQHHHLQQLKHLQQLQQHQKAGGRIIQMPQLVRGSQIQTVSRNAPSQSGPPPLVMVSRGGTQGQQVQNARHIIRVSGTGTIGTASVQSGGSHVGSMQSRTSSSSTTNDSQSAASRQAAAKLALRKQLEKTLLQIPPPKPPPPELHFLPSAANNEFIILVGLEEVVNTILEVEKDSKKKTLQRFTDPFRCAQCKTDFTTIWKQDAKQGIMCETCIVSNQKKSLKAEHTNRLKTAFVKALQQEQEIEQRMQQGQNPLIHSTQQQTTRQLHQIPQIQSSQQQSRHRVMNPVPHQRTVLNPAPNTQRVVQPVTYTYIPHVSGVKNSGQSFTYRVPTSQIQMVTKNQISSSHHSAAARQREYLLDMIPSKVLNQNTAVPWKR